jgi:DNA-binding MurR/RpiR family transcriptional regulator
MSDPSSVRENILAVFETLSPKQRQLARFFLDHEDIITFASANDVGEQVGTSAATVVRFCRALGYGGYADLQLAIRTKFPQYRTVVQKLADRMADGGLAENLPVRVTQANIQNVQETINQVSEESLSQAVTALIQTRQIRIFGSGLSAAAALYIEHSLTVLGLPAHACLNGGVAQTLELSQLTAQDLIIVISIWRYLHDTVEAARIAHAVGAVCLALTDSPVSPVATLANHVFIAATEGAAHSRSLTGILSLVDLLGAAIVAKRPQESMQALQRIDNLYRQNGLLLGE